MRASRCRRHLRGLVGIEGADACVGALGPKKCLNSPSRQKESAWKSSLMAQSRMLTFPRLLFLHSLTGDNNTYHSGLLGARRNCVNTGHNLFPFPVSWLRCLRCVLVILGPFLGARSLRRKAFCSCYVREKALGVRGQIICPHTLALHLLTLILSRSPISRLPLTFLCNCACLKKARN